MFKNVFYFRMLFFKKSKTATHQYTIHVEIENIGFPNWFTRLAFQK